MKKPLSSASIEHWKVGNKMSLDKTEVIRVPKQFKLFSSRKLFAAFFVIFLIAPILLLFVYDVSGLYDFSDLIREIPFISWIILLLLLVIIAFICLLY